MQNVRRVREIPGCEPQVVQKKVTDPLDQVEPLTEFLVMARAYYLLDLMLFAGQFEYPGI